MCRVELRPSTNQSGAGWWWWDEETVTRQHAWSILQHHDQMQTNGNCNFGTSSQSTKRQWLVDVGRGCSAGSRNRRRRRGQAARGRNGAPVLRRCRPCGVEEHCSSSGGRWTDIGLSPALADMLPVKERSSRPPWEPPHHQPTRCGVSPRKFAYRCPSCEWCVS